MFRSKRKPPSPPAHPLDTITPDGKKLKVTLDLEPATGLLLFTPYEDPQPEQKSALVKILTRNVSEETTPPIPPAELAFKITPT